MRLTIDIPDELSANLSAMAITEGRAPEAVALDALASHLAKQLELRARLLRGEADVAAGRVVTHDVVMAEMHDWAAAMRTRGAA